MCRIADLPEWLESFRPNDSLYAEAYENTPAPLRALLKTSIAFSFHRWNVSPETVRSEVKSRRTGFLHSETIRPVSWVLAFLSRGFSSPSRMLSALVPAIIAGVERIIVASPAPFAPSIITALELSGLEDSFILSESHAARLYDSLFSLSSEGCILFFPGPDDKEPFSPLLRRAWNDGIAFHLDKPAPIILSLYEEISHQSSGPCAEEIRARLAWLHPDAHIVTDPQKKADAVFSPVNANLPCGSAFTAGPGMEACWPGPSPDFFRTHALSAFLFKELDS